jgi:putative SOS response-associated peptidase YedK
MCARYTLTEEIVLILKRLLVKTPPRDFTPRYNIAPSQNAPVILNEQEKSLQFLRWGLVPSWAKDPAIGYKLINARAESIAEKPSFRAAFQKRRCLIPADGFYEWRLESDGRTKTPMRVRLKSKEPFTFAGLWETWKDPQEKEIRTFTIITTEPNEILQPIHNRMPVMMKAEDEEAWLDPQADLKHLVKVLSPYPEKEMEAYAVSKWVNSPKHDSPDCIEPAVAPLPSTLF